MASSMTRRLEFYFNWKLTLFVIFLFPILLYLGFWQLDRAAEKAALQEKWLVEQSKAPELFEHLGDDIAKDQNFRRVRVEGVYLSDQFWLKENQILDGKIGYQVIMLLKLTSGQLLAVDRGWVEGSPLREFVPHVPTPSAAVMVSGTLVIPSDSKLIREAEVSAKTWPHKILEVDLKVMASQVDKSLFPKLLKLDPDSASALDINWKPINMSSAKHIGYAVQWFVMAIVLIVLFVFASTNLKVWLVSKLRQVE